MTAGLAPYRSALRAAGVLLAGWVVLEAAAIILGFAVVGHHGGGPVQGFDDTVESWWIGHRAHLVRISKVIAVLGDAPGLAGITVAITLLLLALRQRVRALIPLASYLGGEAIVFVTREVIQRHRPPTASGPTAISGVHETSYSYPSGHAVAAVAVLISLGGLAWLAWRAWWPAVVAVLAGMAVATSRLVLGVHWFSDVAIGMALGIPWALLCTFAVSRVTLPFWPFALGGAPAGPVGPAAALAGGTDPVDEWGMESFPASDPPQSWE